MKKGKDYLSIIVLVSIISLFVGGCVLPFLENGPVTIVSKPKLNAVVGVPYKFQLEIDDDSKNKVIFTLLTAPEGMTIEDASGLIKWTPKEGQVGEHEVKIRVNDGWYRDELEFTLTVISYQLKSISVKPTSISFTATNQNKNIESIIANYTDGSSKIIDKEKCLFNSNNSAVAIVDKMGKVTSQSYSNTTIIVSYTEQEITMTAKVVVMVTKPSTG